MSACAAVGCNKHQSRDHDITFFHLHFFFIRTNHIRTLGFEGQKFKNILGTFKGYADSKTWSFLGNCTKILKKH